MNWYKQAKLTDAKLIEQVLKEAGLWDTLTTDIADFWPSSSTPGFQQEKEKPKAKPNPLANLVADLKKALKSIISPVDKRKYIEKFFERNKRLQAYKQQIINALGFPAGVSFE